eukprot:CAMPEP_0194490504 /NCGR_PEP_ID=MMETSP0253-20130528/9701_1 /TAXON_ID=2966 /ORGANISM="Noctiluca scintillans" /LENGTH=253 /DNA_ID=CAMNT_0039331139 /DNA_START=105 /DNA_END=866 /DNA_ORIENTATION=-
MFGVALEVLSMFDTLIMKLTIDAFGPISDNEDGIDEMSHTDEWVWEPTDVLDAARNTIAAVGKGFAIGSATLVNRALFGAFCVRTDSTGVDIFHLWVLTGLLFGGMFDVTRGALGMLGTLTMGLTIDAVGRFTKEAVTSKKNQDSYASCWTLSTTGSLEDAWPFTNGNLLPLREQQFVNYDTLDSGCNGELVHDALTFEKKSATCTEAKYSYIATKGTGKTSSCTVDRPEKCHGIQRRVYQQFVDMCHGQFRL